MAAVAGPTQEATTALTPVPTDLPVSMLCEDLESLPAELDMSVSSKADVFTDK